MSPSVWRSTHSIRCISPSASRLTAWIAPSAARASSGWLSNTYSPNPACTVTTVMLCATTSCSSRAIRSRSRVTASLAARSRTAAMWVRRCCTRYPTIQRMVSTRAAPVASPDPCPSKCSTTPCAISRASAAGQAGQRDASGGR